MKMGKNYRTIRSLIRPRGRPLTAGGDKYPVIPNLEKMLVQPKSCEFPGNRLLPFLHKVFAFRLDNIKGIPRRDDYE
ncbi:MAG: hypothetical protein LBG07_00265, partial [Treponema sp.]|nr:hypothetical protein [Treponema sp.]